MKTLIFALLASSTVSFAAPISGEISAIRGGGFALSTNSDCGRYTIIPANDDTLKTVRRLAPGDTISGNGIADEAACTVSLESIDYVGLKKLLGYWYSRAGAVSVPDFSNMNFYPLEVSDLNSQTAIISRQPINYRYSVTPSEGSEWVLFLSDSYGTTFATIQLFTSSTAVLKLYDSETGIVTQTLRLSKWSDISR